MSSAKSALRLLSSVAVSAAIVILALGLTALAQTESVIYIFPGTEAGQYPTAGVALDAAGNVYGTTSSGGLSTCLGGIGCGVVYMLSPSSSGWTYNLVHIFQGGTDGAQPLGGIIVGPNGALYGTSGLGGNDHTCPALGPGCGTVDEYTPSSGGTWTNTTLAQFNGPGTGWYPSANLTMDAAGNLYGTTYYGGSSDYCAGENGGCGEVFKLAPVGNGGWTETVLHVFHPGAGGAGGFLPNSSVILDAAGNLYGTTVVGGSRTHCLSGCGVVYKLSPKNDGTWKESVLHTFTQGLDGANPWAGIAFDAKGNLYGAASIAGKPNACGSIGCGTVFQMSPQSNGTWSFHVIHSFTGSDGSYPWGTPVIDTRGNLYGTTTLGGNLTCNNGNGCGTVYKVSPSSNGWQFKTLYAFTNSPDGRSPEAGVTLDGEGNIFGTTQYGGITALCCGTVFEIKP